MNYSSRASRYNDHFLLYQRLRNVHILCTQWHLKYNGLMARFLRKQVTVQCPFKSVKGVPVYLLFKLK